MTIIVPRIFKNLFKKRLYRLLILLFILLFIGFLWQNIMVRYEDSKLKYPGQLIDVNKHLMHIYGEGKGSPAVIFTVGSGTPCAYTDYYFIQKQISKSTRAISYDRPGYGWSEPTSIPRTIDEQAGDLHILLSKSGEKPPYILVGHSLSSLEVIRYAQLFPKEVSGIVLIDGGNPEYYADYYEPAAVFLNYFLEGARKVGIIRALGSIGVLTPMAGEDKRYKMLPGELKEFDKMMFFRNIGNKTNRSEISNMNENAKQILSSGKLSSIPLVILTSKGDSNWEKTQIDLKDWSSNSRQETIADAGHYIHWDNPNTVIANIQELIEELRGGGR